MKATNIIWDVDDEDVRLPSEILLPHDMEDEEEISDYITECTGFCHKGFSLTKRLNLTVQCMAVYNSGIDVPDSMNLEDAIEYAKAHINEINVGEMEYIGDSDVLDEENCDFEE